MEKRRIEVARDDGMANGMQYFPDGDGPFPLVLSFTDIGGVRPAMEQMAEPLVAAGYAVVQPNVYWREGEFEPFDFSTVWGDPDERKRLMALAGTVKRERTMADARAFVAATVADPRVRGAQIGCVGYCMGGRLTFIAAADLADLVVAGASIHGGRLVTDQPDSPHLSASEIRASMYFGVAEGDSSCTAEDCEVLEQVLTEAGVGHRIEVYEGVKHGWSVPDFPVYDAEASARQWQRVLTLFDEHLHG